MGSKNSPSDYPPYGVLPYPPFVNPCFGSRKSRLNLLSPDKKIKAENDAARIVKIFFRFSMLTVGVSFVLDIIIGFVVVEFLIWLCGIPSQAVDDD